MISLFHFEVVKLWHKKSFLFLIFITLIANLCLFSYSKQTEEIPLSAYQSLQTKLSSLPNGSRYEYISEYAKKIEAFEILERINTLQINNSTSNQEKIAALQSQYPDIESRYGKEYTNFKNYYTSNLQQESIFIKDVLLEFDTLHNYPHFLKSIQEKAKSMTTISIFQNKDSFSTTNIKKTAKDYHQQKEVTITYQLEKGIQDALHFPFSDLAILILVLVIATTSILEEKEKNLLTIIKASPGGQSKTWLAKTLVMVISMAIFTIAIYGSNLLYMQITCTLGDLQSSLVSLASFQQSTLSITILEYLGLFLFTKWMATCAIGLFMMLIAIIAKRKISYFVIILVFLLMQTLLYIIISPTSYLRIFKYINIISLFQTTTIYQYYLNFNFFGTPISLQTLSCICLGCYTVVLTFLSWFFYNRIRHLQLSSLQLPSWIVTKKTSQIKYHISLFLQECYKLFWLQKGIALLLLIFLFQNYTYLHANTYISQEEKTWMEYMKVLAGPITKEKELFIHKQVQYFNTLHEQIDLLYTKYQKQEITKNQYQIALSPLEAKLTNETIFQQIQEQYQYIQKIPGRQFITPFGYLDLLSSSNATMMTSILFILSMILGISNLFHYEYQTNMMPILLSTSKGHHKLFYTKVMIALFFSILLFFITFFFTILPAVKTYGVSTILAPISSINAYLHLPNYLSILLFIIFHYFMKLFVMLPIIAISSALATTLKNHLQTIFFTSVIFVVPLLLPFMNIHYLDSISLYPILNAASYFTNDGQILPFIWSVTIYSILTILSFRHAKKRYLKKS